jgi:molybdopterin converting factor small subunit
VKVLFYGPLADSIGRDVELDAGTGCSVRELREKLGSSHPAAAGVLARSRAIIGGVLAPDELLLAHGDAVEFLPPVSGG